MRDRIPDWPFEGPVEKLLRDLDHAERLAGFDRSAAGSILGQQANALLDLPRPMHETFLDSRNDLHERYEALIESINPAGSVSHTLENAIREAGLNPRMQAYAGALEAGQSVRSVLSLIDKHYPDHSTLHGLSDYVGSRNSALTSVALAASHFDQIGRPESFLHVGVATHAGLNAFFEAGVNDLNFEKVIDPFFGDWSRINEIPKRYEIDPGARKEVVREIGADESLTEVETEEAAVVIEENLYDDDGEPLILLGKFTGIYIAQKPGQAAFAFITEAERRYRAIIQKYMSETYGENWLADRYPTLRSEWTAKRDADKQAGLPARPLIEYSNFYELNEILRENESKAIPMGGYRVKDVTKRFNALIPQRNYICHSRPVQSEILFGVILNILKIEDWLMNHLDEDED